MYDKFKPELKNLAIKAVNLMVFSSQIPGLFMNEKQ